MAPVLHAIRGGSLVARASAFYARPRAEPLRRPPPPPWPTTYRRRRPKACRERAARSTAARSPAGPTPSPRVVALPRTPPRRPAPVLQHPSTRSGGSAAAAAAAAGRASGAASTSSSTHEREAAAAGSAGLTAFGQVLERQRRDALGGDGASVQSDEDDEDAIASRGAARWRRTARPVANEDDARSERADGEVEGGEEEASAWKGRATTTMPTAASRARPRRRRWTRRRCRVMAPPDARRRGGGDGGGRRAARRCRSSAT